MRPYGCLSRRYFLEKVNSEFKRFHRYSEHFSFLMIDLDYFKQINDKFGHEAGDCVLSRFSDLVKGLLRAGDSIGRLGGDEFGILLPETDKDEALDVAVRILNAVSGTKVEINPETRIHFTVSIGTATSKNTDKNSETIVSRADSSLYEAKKSGRNQVK